MPVTDDLVFSRYHFDTLQVDNVSWSLIYQLEWPHKNSEDKYEEHIFWDLNSQNISQQMFFGVR